MRDGVELSCSIFRPLMEGRFPVILQRTPYSSLVFEGPPIELYERPLFDRGKYFAQRGYVFVLQDCRGKNESNGVFYPWINETNDGYDTQEWCGRQSWSNGKVGTIGESYQAKLQWLAALLQNKHLKTMVSIVPDPDPFLNFPYWNGAFFLYGAVWSLVLVNGRRNQLLYPYSDLEKMLRNLPLANLPKYFGRESRWWNDWIKHSKYDQYWKKISYQNKYNRVRVPVLHITGWYDLDGLGSHLNFIGMQKKGATELARKNQKLIVGPWAHVVNTSTKIAGIDFGRDAVINLDEKILEWFDHWLKGLDNGINREPPVDIFVMGDNNWRSESEWPLKRAIQTKYYFHSGGRANSVSGKGKIDTNPPTDEPPDTFTYDPDNPVPDLAPPIYSNLVFGAEDQRPVEERSDVLVYSSEILKQDVEITGRVTVHLCAASDARDTDFVAKLVDVFPDGYAMRIWDGIIRARFRDSLVEPRLLTPEKVYKYNIDLWFTCNVFRKGHRIRVEISSSRFPQFDRNPNTGRPFGLDATRLVAHQTVFHNSANPSHIVLPIVHR